MTRTAIAVAGTIGASALVAKTGLDLGPFNSFAFLVACKLGLKPLRR